MKNERKRGSVFDRMPYLLSEPYLKNVQDSAYISIAKNFCIKSAKDFARRIYSLKYSSCILDKLKNLEELLL